MARALLLLSYLQLALVVLLLLTTSPTLLYATSKSSSRTTTTQLSKKLNKNVEDLYSKAEKLQDRAFQRVYELQTKAQELQDRALQRSQQLEQQSQSILEKATLQAKQLQQQASRNLGELQSAIEGLPIPSSSLSGVHVLTVEQQVDASVQVGKELDVDMSVTETTSSSSPQQQVVVPNKWRNVQQRTVPAIVMLASLAAYIRLGGSFIPLIFIIQLGLFVETTTVAKIHNNIGKWWWFVTAVVATNGHFLKWNHADAIAYSMAAMGLVVFVLDQNKKTTTTTIAPTLVFHSHLATLAATITSLLILVGQSSFWIATLQAYGLTWILYPAFLVIINDTMAYVFGMLLGKHPLLPIISPKKTWEGFLGATVSTLAVSYPLLTHMTTSSMTNHCARHALAIGTFVSLISPFGGFLASIVKRAYNQKDFATWIPGHGGVVDRLDCQVFTAPFVYYYLSTFSNKQSGTPAV